MTTDIDPKQYANWIDSFFDLITEGLELGLEPGAMRGELEAALENAREELEQ